MGLAPTYLRLFQKSYVIASDEQHIRLAVLGLVHEPLMLNSTTNSLLWDFWDVLVGFDGDPLTRSSQSSSFRGAGDKRLMMVTVRLTKLQDSSDQ